MIYVFKTSVTTKKQMKKLKPYIDEILPNKKWNFDLEDSDRILRIENEEENSVKSIIDLLKSHHYDCQELE